MSCISSDEIVKNGTLAQVVEQWTENPCVLGSTPRGTTSSFHLPPYRRTATVGSPKESLFVTMQPAYNRHTSKTLAENLKKVYIRTV